MDRASDRSPRTRPVAGLPQIDQVDCAKRWLIELIASAPLQSVAAVPVADLAGEAPALCEAVVDAVRSDEALASLESSPASSSIARLIGDSEPPAVVAAVDALRRALRMALAARMPDPPASLAADLGDRLAYVCSILLERSLARPEPEDVIPLTAEPDLYRSRPLPFARSSERPERDVDTVATQETAEPWTDAVTRRRRTDEGSSFGVLAIEIDDLDRLVAAHSSREVAVAIETAERALTAELSPGDEIVRQGLGHHLIVAGEGDHAGLREMGERLASAISAVASLAGVPLTASVGIALYPDDGTDEDDLMARADERLFAARAAGVRLA